MFSSKLASRVFASILVVIFSFQSVMANICFTQLTYGSTGLPSVPVAIEMLDTNQIVKENLQKVIEEGESVMGPEGTKALRLLIEKYGQEITLLFQDSAAGELDKIKAMELWNKLLDELDQQIKVAKSGQIIFENSNFTPLEEEKIQESLESLNAQQKEKVFNLTAAAKAVGKKAAGVTAAVSLLGFFLIGVNGVSSGIKMFGAEHIDAFFGAVSNPVVGLFSAILATSMLQSSSATTSLIVGLVASGVLPMEAAIFMIMGANIGTSVTNSMVAIFGKIFGTMKGKGEFRDAFHAATVHDIFNWLTVGVLLPLEMTTGFLAKATAPLANLLAADSGGKFSSPLKMVIKKGVGAIKDSAHFVMDKIDPIVPDHMAANVEGSLVLGFSAALLYGGIFGLSKILKSDGIKKKLKSVFQTVRHPLAAIGVGAAATTAMQSSSLTTSMLVPLAAAGTIAIDTAFLVTMGANIGTTSTALLASLGAGAAALQIALVHTLFNLTGTAMFLPKFMRNIPIKIAGKIADFAEKKPLASIVGVSMMFIGIPLAVVASDSSSEVDAKVQAALNGTASPAAIVEQVPNQEPVVNSLKVNGENQK